MAGASKQAGARPVNRTRGIEPSAGWRTALPWAGLVLRLLLAAVWIWAAVSKLGDPSAFVRAVRAYDLVPDWLAKGIGYGLPFLEISLGVFLAIGLGTRLVSIVSGLLFVAFLIGIVQASARGLTIECGCFGGGGSVQDGQSTTYTLDILRDIGLLIAAALVAWVARTRYDADEVVRRTAGPDPMSARVGPRRTKAAQERLAALRAKRARDERNRILIVSAGVLAVLVAVGFIGVGVQAHRASIRASETPPPFANGDGYIVGQKNAPVTVDVYEDFICPACRQFETTDKNAVASILKSGDANLRYIPLGYLDRFSTTDYSSRAANAAACMPDAKTFKKFHDLLYAHQPEENSAGLSDKQLISYGKQAGADVATLTTCVNSRQYKGWVAKVTDDASKANVTHTPTIRINGKEIQNSQGGIPGPDDLKKAVAAAKSAAQKAK